nr:MAG TPA: hypothetical protein [Caudoviricetes sp.]
MFCRDSYNLYSGDRGISYSVDYINSCIHMYLLQLYYNMSDDEIAKYMYYYGDRDGY